VSKKFWGQILKGIEVKSVEKVKENHQKYPNLEAVKETIV
jgi:hypothetical protein